jgi:hypothetical protein
VAPWLESILLFPSGGDIFGWCTVFTLVLGTLSAHFLVPAAVALLLSALGQSMIPTAMVSVAISQLDGYRE